ncbi:MAG: nucleotidyltransferase domain-containing protein [Thermodesulfobacteriota bacterium]|jgi:hypothetical protein
MPVRSLRSSVLKWPEPAAVVAALEAWLPSEVERHPALQRFGYFGSYARGDWGVGSDLDLVAIVDAQTAPFERRALSWRTEELPVPADLLVYTRSEWEAMEQEAGRFVRTLEDEVVWVWTREGACPAPSGRS